MITGRAPGRRIGEHLYHRVVMRVKGERNERVVFKRIPCLRAARQLIGELDVAVDRSA